MTALTATERSKRHQAQRRADGWRLLYVQLPPETARLLADIEAHEKERTTTEIVARAIEMYRSEARY